jgi:glycosyltransferase involved in cell wall biosynthesis
VARSRPELCLVIAGPDEGVKASLLEQIGQRGIAERCVFTGMVAGETKQALLYGSDFFALPSFSENFAITAIEAALCGLPVLLSDRVNIWHEFAAAEAACVVPPTSAAFAGALAHLLEHPGETEAMAKRGAMLVRQRFTWDALADAYEQIYATAAATGALPILP